MVAVPIPHVARRYEITACRSNLALAVLPVALHVPGTTGNDCGEQVSPPSKRRATLAGSTCPAFEYGNVRWTVTVRPTDPAMRTSGSKLAVAGRSGAATHGWPVSVQSSRFGMPSPSLSALASAGSLSLAQPDSAAEGMPS
jgi:hypothetical protein